MTGRCACVPARIAHPDDHDATGQPRAWNRARLAPQTPDCRIGAPRSTPSTTMRLHRSRVHRNDARGAHRSAPPRRRASRTRSSRWFEALKENGPGQGDALFPWLADARDARRDALVRRAGSRRRSGLRRSRRHGAGEDAGASQTRTGAQLLGRDGPRQRQGHARADAGRACRARSTCTPHIETTLAPSLALGNTMAALATNRAYAYHALGALGVIELTAPGRAAQVSAGLRRLKVVAPRRGIISICTRCWISSIPKPGTAKCSPPSSPKRPEARALHRRRRADAPAMRRALLRRLPPPLWGGDGAHGRQHERRAGRARSLRCIAHLKAERLPFHHTNASHARARDRATLKRRSARSARRVRLEPAVHARRRSDQSSLELHAQRRHAGSSAANCSQAACASRPGRRSLPALGLSDDAARRRLLRPGLLSLRAFLRAELPRLAPRAHIVDIGAGAGVGAIAAARAASPTRYVTLTDINPHALRLAAINWVMARLGPVDFAVCDALPDALAGVTRRRSTSSSPTRPTSPTPRIAPIATAAACTAREVSLALGADGGASACARGGAFLLYTGSAIVDGEDRLEGGAAGDDCAAFDVAYREIDPDVFGEELGARGLRGRGAHRGGRRGRGEALTSPRAPFACSAFARKRVAFAPVFQLSTTAGPVSVLFTSTT